MTNIIDHRIFVTECTRTIQDSINNHSIYIKPPICMLVGGYPMPLITYSSIAHVINGGDL